MKQISPPFARLRSVLITFVAILAITAPMTSTAAESERLVMAPFKASLKDKLSLQRGAKLFVNYCLSCHSAKYMRYNRMAKDLGLPQEVVKRNMMFTAERIGDPMQTTMSEDLAKQWFGVAPPDLTLIGRLRSEQWLYNYFRTFYLDENSPSGWNNVVFENVAMPHAMHELQGLQRAVFRNETDENGNTHKVLSHFEQTTTGKLSPQEYDQAIRDLTNFLVYMGEPVKLVRVKYGMWVMLFLGILVWLTVMLKNEYWRDVK